MKEIIYNGTHYRTYSELPAIGSRAPDVSLVNTWLQDVSLANFMGMRKVINIFPSIDTPVCAKSVIVFNNVLPFSHCRIRLSMSSVSISPVFPADLNFL